MTSKSEHQAVICGGVKVTPKNIIPRRARLPMNQEQPAPAVPTRPDPTVWVDQHGNYLFRSALFRLRDRTVAEDVVQETLLSALQTYHAFEGRGSERTWLTGKS